MYPDLSYFFHDVFGTPYDNWTAIFKTFGLFLGLTFFVAAFIVYRGFKRKAEEGIFKPVEVRTLVGKPAPIGDIISNAIFGFILGFKIPFVADNFAAFKLDPASLIFSTQGNLLWGLVGAAAFAALRYWEGQRNKLPEPKMEISQLYPHDRISDITVMAALSGIVGAKVFAVLEDLPSFFADPIGQFFSGSGLAIYGGLIMGFLGVVWYLNKNKISWLHSADVFAPALMIGYGIGRIGCQLSGDGDWGIVNELAQPSWWFLPNWLWAYDYPRNVLNQGEVIEGLKAYYNHRLVPKVYPTPVYETITAFTLGGVLLALRKRMVIPGTLFALYLFFTGVERYFIEKIRVNIRYEGIFNMTQAEIISIGMLLASILMWYYSRNVYNKHKKA